MQGMIRLKITRAAFAATAATLPLRSVANEREADANGDARSGRCTTRPGRANGSRRERKGSGSGVNLTLS